MTTRTAKIRSVCRKRWRAHDPVAEPRRRVDQLGDHDEVPGCGRVDPDRVDDARQRVRHDDLAQHLAAAGAQGVRDVDERARARVRTTSAVISVLKKTVPMNSRATLDGSPRPSQMMSSGMNALAGR